MSSPSAIPATRPVTTSGATSTARSSYDAARREAEALEDRQLAASRDGRAARRYRDDRHGVDDGDEDGRAEADADRARRARRGSRPRISSPDVITTEGAYRSVSS